jgi:hypothetical protein
MILQEQPLSSEVYTTPPPCTTCHQKTLPEYYFCPNCGNKLASAPLSTSFLTQVGIYLLSIILPSLCFLFITKWPAMKYVRSLDPKAQRIGKIAWFLLIASTIFTFWYAYIVTQKMMQTLNSAINTSIGTTGY